MFLSKSTTPQLCLQKQDYFLIPKAKPPPAKVGTLERSIQTQFVSFRFIRSTASAKSRGPVYTRGGVINKPTLPSLSSPSPSCHSAGRRGLPRDVHGGGAGPAAETLSRSVSRSLGAGGGLSEGTRAQPPAYVSLPATAPPPSEALPCSEMSPVLGPPCGDREPVSRRDRPRHQPCCSSLKRFPQTKTSIQTAFRSKGEFVREPESGCL